MPRPTPTEIRINEQGNEYHESWLLIRASNISGAARLFDSEIVHQHYIEITISRCTRKRDLKHDWIYATKVLMEIDMSQAQWGAFVSSFGQGSGVPATLASLNGEMIPEVATVDSRLAKSHEEVRNTSARAVAKVREAHAAVNEAFEKKLGVKETRARLRTLDIVMQNLPANMEYAAQTLTKHVENVTVKMRSDIEAMVLNAQQQGQMEIDASHIIKPEIAS